MDNDALDKLIACRACDLLIEQIPLIESQQAHCPRCNNLLYQGRRNHLNKTLIVSTSGLMMIVPAYFLPMMEMEALGIHNSASVLSSIPTMMTSSYWIAGIGLLLFVVIFPIMILGISFWITLHLRLELYPDNLKFLQKLYQRMVPWGMPEVYILGLLVAFIKLLDSFTVSLGVGMFCFILLMFSVLLVTTTVSQHYFWDTIHNAKSQ